MEDRLNKKRIQEYNEAIAGYISKFVDLGESYIKKFRKIIPQDNKYLVEIKARDSRSGDTLKTFLRQYTRNYSRFKNNFGAISSNTKIIGELTSYQLQRGRYMDTFYQYTVDKFNKISFAEAIELNQSVCYNESQDIIDDKLRHYQITYTSQDTLDDKLQMLDNYLKNNTSSELYQILIQLDDIREILLLNDDPFSGLPDELLLVAFTADSDQLTFDISNYIQSRYDTRLDYESFEYVGDSILEFIIRNIIFSRYPFENPGKMTRMSSLIVRNSALDCFMKSNNLCRYIKGYQSINQPKALVKMCADTFEAILGCYFIICII